MRHGGDCAPIWALTCGLLALGACRDQAAEVPNLPGEGASRVAQASVEHPIGPAIPAGAPKVAFLGDSIAAGLHLSADEAFPAVLQRELAAAGLPFELVNAGVSGDTTAGGLRRADWVLSSRPDVLVVELGGNDGLRGQELAAIEQNLRAIVRRAQAAGARVLLLGVQLPSSYGQEYTLAFEALYERVAREERAAFVPRFMQGVGGVAEFNLEDGLHPSAEGHRRIARRVQPVLAELLRRP